MTILNKKASVLVTYSPTPVGYNDREDGKNKTTTRTRFRKTDNTKLACDDVSHELDADYANILVLRWLKTVSSTFQDVNFDVSLLPFFIS